MYKYPVCSECERPIKPGDLYSVICGEIVCEEHADDYLKEEMSDKFKTFRDQLAEVMGMRIYVMEDDF